jgi:hypothetical protein
VSDRIEKLDGLLVSMGAAPGAIAVGSTCIIEDGGMDWPEADRRLIGRTCVVTSRPFRELGHDGGRVWIELDGADYTIAERCLVPLTPSVPR